MYDSFPLSRNRFIIQDESDRELDTLGGTALYDYRIPRSEAVLEGSYLVRLHFGFQ